jgi:hypothetical protein
MLIYAHFQALLPIFLPMVPDWPERQKDNRKFRFGTAVSYYFGLQEKENRKEVTRCIPHRFSLQRSGLPQLT